MGTGGRVGLPSEQSRQAYQAERARQRQLKLERDRARQAIKDERDAWIKTYRDSTGKYGWGPLWWLLQWWQEKRAWEEEMDKRAKRRNTGAETELRGLIDAGESPEIQGGSQDQSARVGGGGGPSPSESGGVRKRRGKGVE